MHTLVFLGFSLCSLPSLYYFLSGFFHFFSGFYLLFTVCLHNYAINATLTITPLSLSNP